MPKQVTAGQSASRLVNDRQQNENNNKGVTLRSATYGSAKRILVSTVGKGMGLRVPSMFACLIDLSCLIDIDQGLSFYRGKLAQ